MLLHINNCSDMSISDTLTRVIIVIEHPQLQLAFIIPIYMNQVIVVIPIIIMSILELIVTGLFIISLSLVLYKYYILYYMNVYIYLYNYNSTLILAHMILTPRYNTYRTHYLR